MPDSEQPDLTRLTVDLLSAYFATNSVPSSELAALIDQTRLALAGESASTAKPQVHKPAVTVEDSLASKEHILSLIDGKPYKSLKRHLANNGLTPAEYRSRYDLAADYPMVAPAYSEHRRAVAQRMGLGGRPGAAKAKPGKPGSAAVAQSASGIKADAPAKNGSEVKPEASPSASAGKLPAAKAKSSTTGKGTSKAPDVTEKPSDAPRSAKKRFAREPKAASPEKAETSKTAEAPANKKGAAAPKPASGSSKVRNAKAAKASSPAAKSAEAASAPAAGAADTAKKSPASKPRNRKSAGETKASKGTGARTNTAPAADKAVES